MTRVVSAMQFFNSLAFALVGLTLLLSWRATAASVIAAFGAASLLSAAYGAVRLQGVWRNLPDEVAGEPQGQFCASWRRLQSGSGSPTGWPICSA